MSSFTSRLEVSPLPDGRHWRLIRSFTYAIGHEDSIDIITVPAGFITDFTSSPFIFWPFIPKWGKYGKAAIVHDYLYQFLRWMLEQPQYKPLFDHFDYARDNPRKFADDIFKEAMQVLDVAPWRVFLMYYGIRAFGWLAW